jgi:nicotinate-nucleotide--dimethylbenzimidazole phosphoribosyltransferase
MRPAPILPELSLEPAGEPRLPDRAALAARLAGIRPLDPAAMAEARRRLDQLTKPLGSLGRLEEAVVRLAGIAGSADPDIADKCIVIMCADNGVVEEGVSSCPPSVTAAVAGNFTRGLTGVNVFGRLAGSRLRVIDIGIRTEPPEPGIHRQRVRSGTANLARESAMTESEALRALAIGIGTASCLKQAGCRMMGTGEMGIGNTTTSAAVAAVLCGQPAERMVGRGAGLSDAALERKTGVIRSAIELHRPDPADPLAVLARLGGLDIAGLAGCFLGAALERLPIVIDGFIAAAAALVALRLAPACGDFMFASHGSAEPGARLVHDALGHRPLLDLDMRLGEGSGAALAFPLFDAALAAYRQMGSFDDARIEAYRPQS